MAKENTTSPINCACVIHGDAYSWDYVDRLYNMLSRHLTPGIHLHVFTEADRLVPPYMIKHELKDWKIGGPKQAWWYKMQLFNSSNFSGPLLYFDLDTVIVKNIDWIWQQCSLKHFWTVRDFKYLWKSSNNSANTSIMWWDTTKFSHIWEKFKSVDLQQVIKQFRGDQDYLNMILSHKNMRFFNIDQIKSYRWQVLNGGYDFKKSTYLLPNSSTQLDNTTSVLIFHGKPKPENCGDPVVLAHWQ